MEDKKADQRVIKTRLLLINTMLDLLRNKSFVKITVNDICKTAMVRRSTFLTIVTATFWNSFGNKGRKDACLPLSDDAIASFYAGGIASLTKWGLCPAFRFQSMKCLTASSVCWSHCCIQYRFLPRYSGHS